MKRKITMAMLLVLMMCVLTGCGYKGTIKLSKNLKSGTIKEGTYYSKDELTSNGKKVKSSYDVVKYNKVKYYCDVKAKKLDKTKVKKCFDTLNTKKAVIKYNNTYFSSNNKASFTIIEVTFPYKVKTTNGKLAKNKKTVTWDFGKCAKEKTDMWAKFK